MWTIANQLTVSRILLTPLFVGFLLSHDNTLVQWSLVVYAVAALTDFYDGYLARLMKHESNIGKFLDPLADKFLTLGAFIAFIYLNLIPLWMVLIVVARDVIITLLRMYADWQKQTFVTMRVAKWKTALQLAFIFYTLILLTAQHTVWLRNDFGDLIALMLQPLTLEVVMFGLTLFTVVTGVFYFTDNRQLLHTLVTQRFRSPSNTGS